MFDRFLCNLFIRKETNADSLLVIRMVRIKITDASVRIPIFDANTRSLRADFVKTISNKRLLSGAVDVKIAEVLKAINLEVKDGDAIGIIGKNGSGKTSLLRLISKIYEPTDGKVEINGTSRSLLSLGSGLEPSLSGRENIKRLLYLFGEYSEFDNELDHKTSNFQT